MFDLDACGQRGHARRAAAPAAPRRRSRSGSRGLPESSSSCRAAGRTAAPRAASRSRATVGRTRSASPASSVTGGCNRGAIGSHRFGFAAPDPPGVTWWAFIVLSSGSVPARITTACVRPTGTSTAASLTEEGAAAQPPPGRSRRPKRRCLSLNGRAGRTVRSAHSNRPVSRCRGSREASRGLKPPCWHTAVVLRRRDPRLRPCFAGSPLRASLARPVKRGKVAEELPGTPAIAHNAKSLEMRVLAHDSP